MGRVGQIFNLLIFLPWQKSLESAVKTKVGWVTGNHTNLFIWLYTVVVYSCLHHMCGNVNKKQRLSYIKLIEISTKMEIFVINIVFISDYDKIKMTPT